jgi:hypothetical protein
VDKESRCKYKWEGHFYFGWVFSPYGQRRVGPVSIRPVRRKFLWILKIYFDKGLLLKYA